MMDLNSAIHTAKCGGHLRDDTSMKPEWTMRYVKDEELLYYFTPEGEKAHRVRFSDAQRTSIQWRTVP